MKPIDPAGFEQKFRGNIDPWDYATSPFERYKRGVLLHACGSRKYGRGLELACAIGETTKCLARLCLRLIAVDSSPTALKEAKRRLSGFRNVTLRQAVLPDGAPRGPFDLIVASELAYYLGPSALRELLQKMELALAPGGRIVFLNHSRPIGDAAQSPERAQRKVRSTFQKSMSIVFHKRHSRFDVVAFRKRRILRPAE